MYNGRKKIFFQNFIIWSPEIKFFGNIVMPKLIKAVVKKLPQLSGFHMVNFFFNRLNTFFI